MPLTVVKICQVSDFVLIIEPYMRSPSLPAEIVGPVVEMFDGQHAHDAAVQLLRYVNTGCKMLTGPPRMFCMPKNQ